MNLRRSSCPVAEHRATRTRPQPPADLESLLRSIRACRHCRDTSKRKPLPHEPRPVLRVSSSARIGVFGQAPGVRVHASGLPFTDPSGVRLRTWMGVSEEEFYDASRIAILPMGFCFPGQTADGADLPPRAECAVLWRDQLMAALPGLELVLLVGRYAQAWHLKDMARPSLHEAVSQWAQIREMSQAPKMWPLPHPSWRNNAWLKRNPWFEADVLPALRLEVRHHL